MDFFKSYFPPLCCPNYSHNNYIEIYLCVYAHNLNKNRLFSPLLFLLNFIEKLVRVFCTPSFTIFYVPFRCLHFPVRDIIFYSKRRYVPYTSIVRLCCKITVIEGNYVSALMFVRNL